jgi:hypothetical protein
MKRNSTYRLVIVGCLGKKKAVPDIRTIRTVYGQCVVSWLKCTESEVEGATHMIFYTLVVVAGMVSGAGAAPLSI